MIEYEIFNNDESIGKININNDINFNFNNYFIRSKKGTYKALKNSDLQQYIISYTLNDVDELYDIVAKYIEDNNKRFEEIDRIKKFNKIKHIKKNTLININLLEKDLKYFNLSKKDIELSSLFSSKKYFIEKVLESNNALNKNNFDTIIDEYNHIVNSSNYEFLTDEEKEDAIKKYINILDELINYICDNTEYIYGIDFIIPIKLKLN